MIVKKPAVNDLKRIAIVSVYMNSDIYDLKSGSAKATDQNILKRIVDSSHTPSDENLRLAMYALKVFAEDLSTAQWQVVDPKIILQSTSYKSFVHDTQSTKFLKSLVTTNVATPPDMAYVPFEAVAGKANTIYLGNNDPTTNTKQRLAKLARDLGVDGVAVIQLDLAYKTGLLSSMSGTGLFSDIRGPATPSVAAAVVIVNKNGEIAIQTAHISDGGKRLEAKDTVPMLHHGIVSFQGKPGQATMDMYNKLIRQYAITLKQAIEKELRL